MHNLSNNLKSLRKKRGLTQQQVADYLNVTHAAYNFYERGSREPNITTLIRLADLFDVPLDLLTGRYIKAIDNRITVENNFVANGGINIHQGM
jgi:transcriptional regulator with XRE-family HTH domain